MYYYHNIINMILSYELLFVYFIIIIPIKNDIIIYNLCDLSVTLVLLNFKTQWNNYWFYNDNFWFFKKVFSKQFIGNLKTSNLCACFYILVMDVSHIYYIYWETLQYWNQSRKNFFSNIFVIHFLLSLICQAFQSVIFLDKKVFH